MVYRDMKASSALHELSNPALLEETARLARMEQVATAELITALAEVDARRLYLGQGCSSMYVYCTRVLHLSEHAAYDRIEAARLGRRFPVVFGRLACGALTLTNLRLLAPHLTPENVDGLLDEAAHKSKHDVEALTARFGPGGEDAGDVYTLSITVSRETRDKLTRAQELLRHAVPDGDVGAIFDRALTLLIAQVEKKKIGSARARRSRSSRRRSRHVPMSVRREVWQRDGGRCAFVGPEGRCDERAFLEFHHVQPYASGGESDVANIQLRCQAHNQHEADVYFGDPGASTVREDRCAWVEPTGPGTCSTGPGTSWRELLTAALPDRRASAASAGASPLASSP